LIDPLTDSLRNVSKQLTKCHSISVKQLFLIVWSA